jgi:acyl-CoA synthetase (AMP-forming)/AMP-acid ligase II
MGFSHTELFRAVGDAVPNRHAVIHRDYHVTYAELDELSSRIANLLLDNDVGIHRERTDLTNWESGQDHVGLYLYNGWEYLAATLGASAARAVPFNVNYRYVAAELAYLLNDANCAVLIYHATFASTVETALPLLDRRPLLLQVADDSAMALLPGARDFHTVIAGASSDTPPTTPSGDDLYILYTGGTTGMPKGTLWKQADIYDAALRMGARTLSGAESTLSALSVAVTAKPGNRIMPLAPFIHGAAQWAALGALFSGGTVIIQGDVSRLNPFDVWQTVEKQRVQYMTLVGDSFARPLIEELEAHSSDTSSLVHITSGGAILSAEIKARFRRLLPNVAISDAAGSTEAGRMMVNTSRPGSVDERPVGMFVAQEGICVVDDDRQKILNAGHAGVGWLARVGNIPLGYLGDAGKTATAFPVVDGVRVAIPGDRARVNADGLVELLGREAATINSGGEKIFAEEVEQAVLRHPAIDDVLVVGRPSQQWGQEVVAVIQPRPGVEAADDEIIQSTHDVLAGYKRPKALVRVEQILRSPAGKADYAWALTVATGTER